MMCEEVEEIELESDEDMDYVVVRDEGGMMYCWSF